MKRQAESRTGTISSASQAPSPEGTSSGQLRGSIHVPRSVFFLRGIAQSAHQLTLKSTAMRRKFECPPVALLGRSTLEHIQPDYSLYQEKTQRTLAFLKKFWPDHIEEFLMALGGQPTLFFFFQQQNSRKAMFKPAGRQRQRDRAEDVWWG